jgi:flavorubredoxin
MTNIHEIAPDVFRLSTYVPEFDLTFNQFLINDTEPLLWHTGMRGLFPQVKEAISKILDPSRLLWIGFSHFEADECGALSEWLDLAQKAQVFCTFTAAVVNINDYASRLPRVVTENDVLGTGKYTFHLLPTPQLPHGWDAGLLFEESNRTLFCSDLFTHSGDGEPLVESDVTGKAKALMTLYQGGAMNNVFPFTPHTERMLHELANLKPKTLAIMHGSSFRGDCEGNLKKLAAIMKEILG